VTLDVLVVGGGPVGQAAALYTTQLGLSTLVLEPRPGPVDKACGEGIMPGGVSALAALHVVPQGRRFRGIRYLTPKASATADFSTGTGLGVRRTALHGALTDALQDQEVEVCRLAATGIEQHHDRVDVRTATVGGGPGPVVRTRYVFAADGLHSWTRRTLGLDRPVRTSGRYGLRQHFRVAPWSTHVDVLWGVDAEAYITPVADDVVGVAVLSDQRRSLAEHLHQFPALRQQLADAETVSTVRGAGPLRQRSHRRVAGRVLLLGDASGYVDALTGEGVSLGLAHGRAAAAAVAAGRPGDYERGWVAATWRYTLLTQALLAATRPTLGRRALVPLAARAPRMFTAAIDVLAGPL
jgi:flavin-dependent dehydrogenase